MNFLDYQFDSLYLDDSQQMILKQTHQIPLLSQPVFLLFLLLMHPHEVICMELNQVLQMQTFQQTLTDVGSVCCVAVVEVVTKLLESSPVTMPLVLRCQY